MRRVGSKELAFTKTGKISQAVAVRPLCFATGAYLATLLTALTLDRRSALFLMIFTAALTAVIVCTVIIRSILRIAGALPLVLVVLIPALAGAAVGYNYRHVHTEETICTLDGKRCTVIAEVEQRLYFREYGAAYSVRLISADGRDISGRATFRADYPADLDTGERFRADVTVGRYLAGNASVSEVWYSLSDDMLFVLESADGSHERIPGDNANGLFTRLASLRVFLTGRLTEMFGSGDVSAFLRAVLLGDRGSVAADTRRDFSRLGISHILALSGLHMTLFAGVVNAILLRLRVRHTLRCCICIAFLLFYMALTVFLLSAVRAGIMMSLYYLSRMVRRRIDPPTSLFTAAFIIAIVEPAAVADVGLMLSFTATLGLVTYAAMIRARVKEIFSDEKIKRRPFYRIARALINATATTMSAVVYTLPVSWAVFGCFSPVSLIANLLFVPLLSTVLVLASTALLLYGVPLIGAVTVNLAGFVTSVVLESVGITARDIGCTVSLRYPFVPYVLLVFAVTVAVCILDLRLRRRTRRFFAPVMLTVTFIACISVFSAVTADTVTVIYMNRGINDGIVISAAGTSVYCDISTGSAAVGGDAAGMITDKCYSDRLDVWVMTHCHRRHASSVISVSARMPVDAVYLPEPVNENEEDIIAAVAQTAQDCGAKVVMYSSDGAALTVGGKVRIEIPRRTYISRSTHPVTALNIIAGDHSVAYLGGAVYESALGGFAVSAASDADVLLLGAHSPVTKLPFTLPAYREGRMIVSADPDRLALACGTDDRTEITSLCDGSAVIRLRCEDSE